MACLDTSFLLDAGGRGGRQLKARARDKLVSLVEGGEVLTTTRFNVAELWVGVERTRDRPRERVAVETMLAPLTVLDFDESSARVFGRITAHLYAHGSPRGDMDILIASVVLVHGDRLVTRNARHFAGIPELVVETY
ncbi:MAG: VapC toxin family PIN domain ribonuclease [Candidatus Rokuibacteriota bacterium]|nr:MAG: VapC toxin family PIN domain ribonuclease [Candidatus Rokubacteria bacterium]